MLIGSSQNCRRFVVYLSNWLFKLAIRLRGGRYYSMMSTNTYDMDQPVYGACWSLDEEAP